MLLKKKNVEFFEFANFEPFPESLGLRKTLRTPCISNVNNHSVLSVFLMALDMGSGLVVTYSKYPASVLAQWNALSCGL